MYYFLKLFEEIIMRNIFLYILLITTSIPHASTLPVSTPPSQCINNLQSKCSDTMLLIAISAAVTCTGVGMTFIARKARLGMNESSQTSSLLTYSVLATLSALFGGLLAVMIICTPEGFNTTFS